MTENNTSKALEAMLLNLSDNIDHSEENGFEDEEFERTWFRNFKAVREKYKRMEEAIDQYLLVLDDHAALEEEYQRFYKLGIKVKDHARLQEGEEIWNRSKKAVENLRKALSFDPLS